MASTRRAGPVHETDRHCKTCRTKPTYVCLLPRCGTKICAQYFLERQNCPGCGKELKVRTLG